MTGIGIIGCGFVSNYYLSSLKTHPELKVLGVYDKDSIRMRKASEVFGVIGAKTLEELLMQKGLEIVVNLTPPRDHYELSKICLEAGKHVYSEKPLTMEMSQAKELVDIATKKNLTISCAPCSILGESAQTLWKAMGDGLIGNVRVVYGEINEGPIHQMNPETWRNKLGIPWPAKDEFEIGNTIEHAAYYLSWFAAFFGPAESITAYSDHIIKDKKLHEPLSPSDTPDFSVAVIKFFSGVVARLTCGITAPYDHSLKVVGDLGILSVDECWHYGNPVRIQLFTPTNLQAMRYSIVRNNSFLRRIFGLNPKKLPFVNNTPFRYFYKKYYMDYGRGISELASSIKEGRPCRLASDFSLHINEMVLAIQNAGIQSKTYRMTTTFEPIEPMEDQNKNG